MNYRNKKVACLADLHIGVHQNTSMWHNISLDFARWFKKKLNEDGVEDIIICGDINNDRNEISVNSMCIVNEIFNIWKEFNITIIVGNHDAYYRDRSDVNSLALLSGWDNIEIIDKVTTHKQFDKTMVFCPWGVQIKDIPEADIIFGHFDISGFKMSKLKVCASGYNSKELLKKSDLIITGHFHLREERKYQTGEILYIGSPYELDWGDCGTDGRGFYYLDLETSQYVFVDNDMSPKHKKIRLSELTSAKKMTKSIKDDFKGNIVSFLIDQKADIDKIDSLINNLSLLKPLSIKTEFILEENYGLNDIDYEFTSIDIPASIEEFIKRLDCKNMQSVLEYTLDLHRRVIQ